MLAVVAGPWRAHRSGARCQWQLPSGGSVDAASRASGHNVSPRDAFSIILVRMAESREVPGGSPLSLREALSASGNAVCTSPP